MVIKAALRVELLGELRADFTLLVLPRAKLHFSKSEAAHEFLKLPLPHTCPYPIFGLIITTVQSPSYDSHKAGYESRIYYSRETVAQKVLAWRVSFFDCLWIEDLQ
jgi:hypothetical protein